MNKSNPMKKTSVIDYVNFTVSTWNKQDKISNVHHAILGMIDECGEIAKNFKKQVGYNKDFDRDGTILEIGDYFYYLIRFIDEISLLDDRNFVDQLEAEINNLKVTIPKEEVGTDFCLRLTKETYLICSSFNKFDTRLQVMNAVLALKYLCRYCGTSFPKVIQANIDKLTKRHLEKTGGYNPNNLEDRNESDEATVVK